MKTSKGTELALIRLQGKDYLPVAQRLVWFREERPNYTITTEFTRLDDKVAIAKATISVPDGNILATAHKREDQAHFRDYMEKAETGAIGRALGLIGYGTQFSPDLDEEDRIVDAPQPSKKEGVVKPVPTVAPSVPEMAQESLTDTPWADTSADNTEPPKAGPSERTHVLSLIGKNGWTKEGVHKFMAKRFNKGLIYELSMPQYQELSALMGSTEQRVALSEDVK